MPLYYQKFSKAAFIFKQLETSPHERREFIYFYYPATSLLHSQGNDPENLDALNATFNYHNTTNDTKELAGLHGRSKRYSLCRTRLFGSRERSRNWSSTEAQRSRQWSTNSTEQLLHIYHIRYIEALICSYPKWSLGAEVQGTEIGNSHSHVRLEASMHAVLISLRLAVQWLAVKHFRYLTNDIISSGEDLRKSMYHI